MAQKQNDAEAMNDLLEKVIIGLLDQAESEYSERSGRKIKFKYIQKMKLDLAKKGVEMALNRLGRGSAEEKFNAIVDLTNKHLPYVVSTVGEDAIVNRLEKMDEVVDNNTITLLERAGADELAKLLRKALPEETPAIEPVLLPDDADLVVDTGSHSDVAAEADAEIGHAFNDVSDETFDEAAHLVNDSDAPAVGHSSAETAKILKDLKENMPRMIRLRDDLNAAIGNTKSLIEKLESTTANTKPLLSTPRYDLT